MTSTRWTICGVLVAMVLGLVASASHGATLQELQQRFKQRYPQIQQLKTDGKIGETFEGYVAAVSGGLDEKSQKVLDAENADRGELYQAIAAKEQTTADTVAKRNAVRNFEKARAGEYLRNAKGQWTKKGE